MKKQEHVPLFHSIIRGGAVTGKSNKVMDVP